jgi:hypothetical protein
MDNMAKSLLMLFTLLSAFTFGLSQAHAQNYPCSKSKGGVSHCENGKFVCSDGTYSKSKKTCYDEQSDDKDKKEKKSKKERQ